MKKIIPVTICFLIASLSLSSCGKEKAEDTAGQQAEDTAETQENWQKMLPGTRVGICSG